jgi:hypothetical protein
MRYRPSCSIQVQDKISGPCGGYMPVLASKYVTWKTVISTLRKNKARKKGGNPWASVKKWGIISISIISIVIGQRKTHK